MSTLDFVFCVRLDVFVASRRFGSTVAGETEDDDFAPDSSTCVSSGWLGTDGDVMLPDLLTDSDPGDVDDGESCGFLLSVE